MGFFQDLKEDLSQAVNEMIPDEEGTAGKPIIPSLQEDDDLAEIEAMFRKKEETEPNSRFGFKAERKS